MGTESDRRSISHVLTLQPLTPTGITKFLFLPLAKYIVNADIGTPFYELDANEMMLFSHLYNLADQTRRKQAERFTDKSGRIYILPDTYELCCFMRSSASTIARTLKKLQAHGMIKIEQSRLTRQRILYVRETFAETQTGERLIPKAPDDLPLMTRQTPAMRGFYRIPLTLCGRRGERRNVYSENLGPETILIYSVLLDTAISAANSEAYIESEEEPYIYVRYGYESLGKRLHISKMSSMAEPGKVIYSHTSLRKYIKALEGDEKWSGLIHHTRTKNNEKNGNLKGSNYYSVHDYSVSGNEEGFYLEEYDEYLERMKEESEKTGIDLEDLLCYGQYGYKKEPSGEEDIKDCGNIVVADGNDQVEETEIWQPAVKEDEDVKNGQRRRQKWTSIKSNMDNDPESQKWTTKKSEMDNEEVKSGQRRSQNETTKKSKVDNIKKDNIEKKDYEKETTVYISSTQDTDTVKVQPWEAEVLPAAGSEEEETDRALYPFNPNAPGARQALESYHRRKRMRCSFDEFWRFNENKGWTINGKRVEDVVGLLAGFEARYNREHPMEEIWLENGLAAPQADPELAEKKKRLLQSLMSNKLYGKNVTSEAHSMEYSNEPA